MNHLKPFLSKELLNFSPNFIVRKATKKNLNPLEIKQIIIKIKILKPIIPLVIVKTLKGRGVNPARNKVPSQSITPAFEERSFCNA